MKELSHSQTVPEPSPEISVLPGTPVLSASPEGAFWIRLLKPVRQEVAWLLRGFSAWPLAVLLLISALGLTLAYQAPLDYTFNLGRGNTTDFLYLQSFNPPEANSEFTFRWSTDESYLRFPGIGRLPSAQLDLYMQAGGRPATLPLPEVQLWKDDQLLGEVKVRPDQPRYTFNFREEGNLFKGSLILKLKVLNPFKEAGHDLPLGVVVSQVRLTGGSADGRPVIPSLAHFTFLLAALIAIYLALVRSGWSPKLAASIGGVVGLGAVVSLAAFRLQFTPAVEELFLTTILAYLLLVLGLRTTGWWLARRKLAFPVEQMRWLGLLFLAVFVVKAAGLNHPAFGVIDHWFRIHQIYRFWNFPVAFWEQYFNVSTGATVTGQEGGSAVLGQWGLQVSLPYSPLFYLFAAPLSLFWPDYHNVNLLAAVNDLASWLEATQLFLLYLIVRLAYRSTGRAWAGILAGALFGFYPLSYLLFSDGGYNSIFAAWLSLLFVALLVDWLRIKETGGEPSRWLAAWLILTLAAALLAHTSTLLMLGSLVAFLTVLLLLRRVTRSIGKGVGLIGLGGLGLSLVLYYGWYVPVLVGQTLPTLLGKLESGSVGKEPAKLGGPLLSGFWPQLWEHFRFWPFLGLLGFLLLELKFSRAAPLPETEKVTADSTLDRLDAKTGIFGSPVNLLWCSWLLVFIVFSLLDFRVNLLQKHMLFVAPLFCLGTGLALTQLWQLLKGRERWLRWGLIAIFGGLLLFNLANGLLIWYGRVYFGISPPGSG